MVSQMSFTRSGGKKGEGGDIADIDLHAIKKVLSGQGMIPRGRSVDGLPGALRSDPDGLRNLG